MDVVVVVVVEVGVGVGVGGGGEESGAEEVEGRDAGGEVGEGQPEHERPGAGMGHRQRVFEEGERHDMMGIRGVLVEHSVSSTIATKEWTKSRANIHMLYIHIYIESDGKEWKGKRRSPGGRARRTSYGGGCLVSPTIGYIREEYSYMDANMVLIYIYVQL